MRMRKWRRTKTVFLLLLLLLAGAVINVAVAWACAMPGRPTKIEMESEQRRNMAIELASRYVTLEQPPRGRLMCTGGRWNRPGLDICDCVVMQSHSKTFHPKGHRFHITEWQAGWPLRSMYSARVQTHWELGMEHRGIACAQVPAFIAGPENRTWFVPLGIIRTGFIANSMIYTILCWLLFCGPFVFRTWRRRRKGLCPACAYPVGTSSVCTECGRRNDA